MNEKWIIFIIYTNLIIQLNFQIMNSNETNNSTADRYKQKMKFAITIMLPQDYIRLRNFNVCINKELSRINKGSWTFTKYFYLERFYFLNIS